MYFLRYYCIFFFNNQCFIFNLIIKVIILKKEETFICLYLQSVQKLWDFYLIFTSSEKPNCVLVNSPTLKITRTFLYTVAITKDMDILFQKKAHSILPYLTRVKLIFNINVMVHVLSSVRPLGNVWKCMKNPCLVSR